ncbi:hypothetical protein M3610_16325 [Neobacillus sp. MER 74]|uniref:hypothetical protein n=1 Tax=Neobacillus sp. MER 74 TaxID=2939566 RepID=UPI00203E1785|nr:hypothetical protein [Neobacillus sp. MER 74]MCM3116845.1 hypothetical protein [Neobacillus sp. MER 74]
MNMIVTLKRINNGFFKVEIKPAIGEKYFREFTAEALQQYILDAEAFCEWKNYNFLFVVPDAFKKAAARWLGSLAASIIADTN